MNLRRSGALFIFFFFVVLLFITKLTTPSVILIRGDYKVICNCTINFNVILKDMKYRKFRFPTSRRHISIILNATWKSNAAWAEAGKMCCLWYWCKQACIKRRSCLFQCVAPLLFIGVITNIISLSLSEIK